MNPAARSSTWMLVAANLLPLAGVAFWGWRAQDVVFLYWIENVVIGVFNALRMLAAGADEQGRPESDWAGKIVSTLFFVLHYGGFCAGHGIVVALVFTPPGSDDAGDLLAILGAMARDPLALAGVAAMVAGQAYEFFAAFLRSGAWRRANADALMHRPYRRIIVTQFFVFAAAVALQGLHSPLAAMLAFVVLKTALDAVAQRRELRAA
jgi:hypothetical protein